MDLQIINTFNKGSTRSSKLFELAISLPMVVQNVCCKFQDSSCNWWRRQKERVTALGMGSGSKRDRERCKSASDALTFSNILT